ncbi:hypothetical protein [Leptospira kanakyensis]|uniref:Lipoprotein n=1 Tax=Leptospira kanakyensis TaxID=2484968 RepID=A0A6N4Q3D1_9LEPT|nr:hypothetical protein [Leptospira kanakyensis]MCW7471258.1 hypothetical protein [Leptospira kanakyensis]TGK53501.1 hypothetical protein EHQ11_03905 [Leptospira kanakyensis]TGK57296.1 hypothetical protein EHQ16_15600 [Leptospira kanakyensis]TGK73007.1 hypothetical protein EHQ18_03980 [Leptospira kanakyensis]
MERIFSLTRISSIFLIFLVVVSCSGTKAYVVTPEPTLEQQTAISKDLCLQRFLWLFPGKRPCVYFKAERDNGTGLVQYFLLYEIGTFDVDIPIGVSLKLGETWYNLKRTNTDYSDTIIISSAISSDLIPKIGENQSIAISYTNRKETINYNLSSNQTATFQSNLSKLIRTIESEPKLNIYRK